MPSWASVTCHVAQEARIGPCGSRASYAPPYGFALPNDALTAMLELQREPVEGFLVEPDESDFFTWKVWMEAPSGTEYAGGVFELELVFPPDFPMAPPTLRFVSEFWHPNVYRDGRVCISILHAPGEDALSGELPEERWLPTQTVSTIILSVLSIVGDPNLSSPANVDASVEYKDHRSAYAARARSLVTKAKQRLPARVKIPHPESNAEERAKALERHRILNEESNLVDDFDLNDSEGGIDDDFAFDLDISDTSSFDYNANYSDDEFNYGENDGNAAKKVAKATKGKEAAPQESTKGRESSTNEVGKEAEKAEAEKKRSKRSASKEKKERKKSTSAKRKESKETTKERKKSSVDKKESESGKRRHGRKKSKESPDGKKRRSKSKADTSDVIVSVSK